MWLLLQALSHRAPTGEAKEVEHGYFHIEQRELHEHTHNSSRSI